MTAASAAVGNAAQYVKRNGAEIVLENDSSRYTFTAGKHLRLEQIHNKLIEKDCVRDFTGPRTYGGWFIPEDLYRAYGYDVQKRPGRTPRIFAVYSKGRLLDSGDFSIRDINITDSGDGSSLRSHLVSDHEDVPLEVIINVHMDSSNETLWSFDITNKGRENLEITVVWPVLDYLEVGANVWPDYYEGNLHGNWYFVPRFGGMISSSTIDLALAYGGGAWMQVIDVYHPGHDGGLYFWVKDNTGIYKTFEFKKKSEVHSKMGIWFRGEHDTVNLPQVMQFDDKGSETGWSERPERAGIGIAVHYLPAVLSPGKSISAPDFVAGLHKGDWHAGISSYMGWVRTWYQPRHRAPPWWYQNFGIGGIDYNNYGDSYSLLELFSAGERLQGAAVVQPVNWWKRSKEDAFGKKLDNDAWFRGAYHAETQGYIEEYGGMDGIRSAIDEANNSGKHVVFYTEGMVLSKSSPAGREYGDKWAIKCPDGGKNVFFNVYNSDVEQCWNVCPATTGWQDYLSDSLARIVRETGVDGIYIDSIGARHDLCYNQDHKHKSAGDIMQGRWDLLSKVRSKMDEVNSDSVLWLELPSCDYISQLLDGSWCWTLSGLPGSDDILGCANIFRFCFPNLRLFEFGAENPEKLKRIFFYGQGAYLPHYYWKDKLFVHIKAIYEENYDAFCSESPVPFVETLQGKIYANYFPAKDKNIWTIANENSFTVNTPVLTVDHIPGSHYVELVEMNEVDASVEGEKATLRTSVGAQDVACIVQVPERISASLNGHDVNWFVAEASGGEKLMATLLRDHEIVAEIVLDHLSRKSANVSNLFSQGIRKNDKLVLKLFGGGAIKDIRSFEFNE
jgi:hypothetical protein